VLSRERTVRAIHPASYTRLHDIDLLSMVREFATDFEPPQKGIGGATGLYRGEQDMFIFLIDPTGWVEIDGESFAPGFFLWNSGATRVNVGALAAFNNLKIPLAVACSLIFFGEEANALKLGVGGALVLGALLLNPHAEAGKPCESRRTSPSSSGTPPSSV